MSRTRPHSLVFCLLCVVQLATARSGAQLRALSHGHETPDQNLPLNDDPEVCEPPCVEGQGVCNNNMCFCKSPFRGSSCQKSADELSNARVGWGLAGGIVGCALLFGCMGGVGCITAYNAVAGKDDFTSQEDLREEVWYRLGSDKS